MQAACHRIVRYVVASSLLAANDCPSMSLLESGPALTASPLADVHKSASTSLYQPTSLAQTTPDTIITHDHRQTCSVMLFFELTMTPT